ncbi:tail fiber assembly protein [Enterobacter roggenkampii]|uniref:tail fiber assembly protein n=1 Tax=Enterobacter roggenkampii TaxID=1812935 RepID=UPI0032198A66
MKTIYVYAGDYRSWGTSPDLWGGNTLLVEVPDDFQGGGKTYNPETKEWADDVIIPPTALEVAEQQRNQFISEADTIMADWIIDLQLGTITDENRQNLIAWRAYKEELKAMDLSLAPDIVWPPKPTV